MDQIRVAHVISAQEIYGKEKWLLAFLKYLDLGICPTIVIVLGDSAPSRLVREVSRLGVPCHIVDARKGSSFAAVRDVGSILKANDVQIVHSHDYKSDAIAFASGRSRGCKLVSTPHGWSNELDLKLQLYQLLDKCIMPFFDIVAPLSTDLALGLWHLPKKKVALIFNFVDVPNLHAGGAVNAKSILCIGRLTALKRFKDAIEALRYAKDKSYALQIIGEGPERSKLEKLARKLDLEGRVSFLGFRDDAIDLLGRSAILIHPSTTEGISRVVMEAMALGKIVIGTDIPGIAILIKNKKEGILVPPKSPRAIAAALDWIAENQSAADKIGAEARKRVHAEYTAQAAVRRYEALYRDVMSG